MSEYSDRVAAILVARQYEEKQDSTFTVMEYGETLAVFPNLDAAIAWAVHYADAKELTNRGATIHVVIQEWCGSNTLTQSHIYGTRPVAHK